MHGSGRERGGASLPSGPALTHCLLLSGGLDSTTLAAWVKDQHPGEPVNAYTFLYGQKHAVELEAARKVAAALRHGALSCRAATHPRLGPHRRRRAPARRTRPGDDHRGGPLVRAGPQPAVPGRHGQPAGRLRTGGLWLGVHHDDHTGYPDCRPEFVEAADQAVRLGTQYELRVQAPFVHWTKAEIIRWGLEHGVPYELTHSCYQGAQPGLRRLRHLPGAAGRLRRGRRRRPHPLRGRPAMKTTITVSTTFAAAHRLPDHEGKCRRLHGHTYGLEVTVAGHSPGRPARPRAWSWTSPICGRE